MTVTVSSVVPRRTRAATLISNVLSPVWLVMALPIAVGARATWPGMSGPLWGAVGAFFCGGLPLWFVRRGIRAGRLDHMHIPERRQRIVPLSVALMSVVAGVSVLYLCDAPRPVLVVLGTMLAGLGVTLPLTMRWKVSFHAAVSAATVVVLALGVHPWCWSLAPLVALVGWARVHRRDHTVPQVVVGACIGAAIAVTAFAVAG